LYRHASNASLKNKNKITLAFGRGFQLINLTSVSNTKTVIIVVGPTAVGKTSIAIELAKFFKTEIISADSRQCYRELDIGVARATVDELNQIPHHFIANHSIKEKVTAATFEEFALQKVTELFQTHDIVVMTGGTGLYVKAFAEGMDEIPEVPADIRDRIIRDYEKNGIDWLQQQIHEKDAGYFQVGEIKNPQRLMRALEVVEATGKSILQFQKRTKTTRAFNIVKIGLELPKDELQRHINARVDKMIESGLVEEVKSLQPFKTLNALQTVGYSEIFKYLDGKIDLEQAIEEIKKNTRQYAKRQMTWFQKDKEINWFRPDHLQEIKTFLSSRRKNIEQ
jgi:tRNA dimethylallyltransferase